MIIAMPCWVHAQLSPEDQLRADNYEKQQKEDADLVVDFPTDSITKEILYSEVVKVDSAEAPKLFSRAKLFSASYFKNLNDLKPVIDDYSKTILIKPSSVIEVSRALALGYSGNLTYLVKVECKDNRYRYTLTDFLYHVVDTRSGNDVPMKLSNERPSFFNKKEWHLIQFQAKTESLIVINNLKKQMTVNSSDF